VPGPSCATTIYKYTKYRGRLSGSLIHADVTVLNAKHILCSTSKVARLGSDHTREPCTAALFPLRYLFLRHDDIAKVGLWKLGAQ
jgi:hypothetical protein